MEENAKLTETLQYLKSSFMETNNELRKEAEAKLYDLRN
jgi:hypothetical protein